jgi:hypothetical protein
LLVPTGGFGSSNIRGVAILGHGLNESSSALGVLGGLATNLQADGWVVYGWPYPEDNFFQAGLNGGAIPNTGIAQDINNDAGNGARYLTTNLESWDHIKIWLRTVMPQLHGASGPLLSLPLAVFGESWGGWHSIQVALNRSSDLVAWGAHVPGVVMSAFIPALTEPYSYGAQPAYNSGTTYLAFQTVSFNGFIYIATGTTTGNAPTGTATSNAFWTYLIGPINTTGADVSTLQGIGNGSGGVLPLCVVGWANPDIIAESYLVQPWADTAAGGYYAGLMTENGPLTEGHQFSASADVPYYTAFFTGSLSTSYSAGTTYGAGTMVTYNGFMYSSIAGSTGNAPSGTATSNAFWTYFSTPPWSSTYCVDHLCPKAF